MSIILFVLGAGLFGVGAIRFGTFEAEGPRVRASGIALMMPLIVVSVLSFMVRMITNADASALSFVAFLELPAMAVGVGIAYALLYRDEAGNITIFPRSSDSSSQQRPSNRFTGQSKPEKKDSPVQPRRPAPPRKPTTREHPLSRFSNAESTPERESEKQDEPENRQDPVEAVPEPQPEPPRRTASRSNRKKFPTVMTTAEAAEYLEMPENAVLEMIEQGKLTAARINYRYRISRTVLDEFLKQQEEKDGSAE